MIRRTFFLTALWLTLGAMPALAQNGEHKGSIAPVPFGPGERLTYRVDLGMFGHVGNGSMEVLRVDTLHGHPVYHLRFDVKGSVLFAKVEDRLQSWLDVSLLASRRFEQKQHEVRYKRHRIFDFFPEERRWARVDKDEGGELHTAEPLDDVSFIYFVRTIPLEVGKTYTFDRYFKEDGNPVTVQVLRKEKVTVPAGTFETIVVRPIIKTKGLFGDGGEAEIYFTDDHRRLIVQLRSKVPVIGSLNLYLESYMPGERLTSLEPGGGAGAGSAGVRGGGR